MTTINGVTFNMRNLEPISVVRNVPNDQPGSDENFVTHMGYKGLVMRLSGYEDTLADYDNVIKEFMKVGEQTLVHRTGWQFKVHSAQLNPVLLEGFPNNHFPYVLTLLTSTPYRESTGETTRSKTITTNNQTWTQDDSSNDIDTDGSVDAIPDIKVTGGATHAKDDVVVTNDSNYNLHNGSGDTIWQNSENTVYSYGLAPGQVYGQTVNCRKDGLGIIDYFEFYVDTCSTGGNVTCTVYDSVGGTVLGSKTINITSTGWNRWTFDTPIAVVQDENTCADATDSKKIYFRFTTSTAVLAIQIDNTNPYADGQFYYNDSPQSSYDLRFYVDGEPLEEIRQTFKVSDTVKVSKVTLNMCKYNYTGSNPVTVYIKEGATVKGTGTAVLSGSTFVDVDFVMDGGGEGTLKAGTTYTLSIIPPSDSGNATAVLIKTNTTSVYADGAVTLVEDGATERAQTHDLYFKFTFAHSNQGVEVYNTADTSVKSGVADQILRSAVHRVNIDGTGTVEYDDDFTTNKYLLTNEGIKNVTHDTVNDELDIADDGYIFWKCDTKYTVTGIPTLTSRINITAGTPTIQISSNGTTWYDITTAVVDDVETVYELDSSSLHLKGLTEFYWRYDCVKAAAATASIKTFELDVNIVTIDVEHPKVSESGVSTIRCDQDDESGMAAVVALIFRDRSWAI